MRKESTQHNQRNPSSSEMKLDEIKKILNDENFLKKFNSQPKDKLRYERNKGIVSGNRSKRIRDSGKSKPNRIDPIF
jgi:hypothetical protein